MVIICLIIVKLLSFFLRDWSKLFAISITLFFIFWNISLVYCTNLSAASIVLENSRAHFFKPSNVYVTIWYAVIILIPLPWRYVESGVVFSNIQCGTGETIISQQPMQNLYFSNTNKCVLCIKYYYYVLFIIYNAFFTLNIDSSKKLQNL